MNIEISDKINQRLGTHTVGFETQDQVIERLLDHYEDKLNQDRPVVKFVSNESDFKRNLVQKKFAWKELHFNDGSVKVEEWVATQFKETSNLRSNIWSGPLRGWKNKSINKLILSIEKPNIKNESNDSSVDIQVGKFVKMHINSIVSSCNKYFSHKQLLTDEKWCRDNLCIFFPFLMLSKNILDKGLHARYWTVEYEITGVQYRFCSQFGGSTLVGGKTLSEQHGEKFLKHLEEYNLLLPEFKNKKIKFSVRRA